MKNIARFILIIFLVLNLGCSQEELFQDDVRHDYWISHKGADLPLVVEGNTSSKVFVILLHGGPGGSSQEYNIFNKPFTKLLENNYAMVYYDQRNAGMARGDWNEELFTIEQHIEDLEKVIEFVKFQYGEDIRLFLAGHSWGGYLGTAYLVKGGNQNEVVSWINIDGQINRNRMCTDILNYVNDVAENQMDKGNAVEDWEEILELIEEERALGILQYDVETEQNPFRITNRSERILSNTGLFSLDVSSSFTGIYTDNYHPFIAGANGSRSNDPLVRQMYNKYDNLIEEGLSKITIPVFSIYGKYDVRTPRQQGQYLIDNISTSETDKGLGIIEDSGHSPMRNEPELLANFMIQWIEKYR